MLVAGFGEPHGAPALTDQLEVEDQVAGRAQPGSERRFSGEQLADGHPLRIGIHESAELGQEVGQLGLVLVEEVDLPIVGTPAEQAARVGRQVHVLKKCVEDVEPETIHAPLQPRADHREHGRANLRIAPVQVGLLG